MSGGQACRCRPKDRAAWQVLCLRHNHSAFNGYHWTDSDYSRVRCQECNAHWRTTAAYVDTLPVQQDWHR